MQIRKSHALVAALVAAIAIPVITTATAAAAPDTQPPLQGRDAGVATLHSLTGSFLDAANGQNRPSGADGTETEFPTPSLDGPPAGLVRNGPLE